MIAVAIETAIQNGGIGVVVLNLTFPRCSSDFNAYYVLYQILHIPISPSCGIVSFVFAMWSSPASRTLTFFPQPL